MSVELQLDPLTSRARAVWTAGDFHFIARSFVDGAEEFVRRISLRPGEQVLDVACGTGNLAIPAACAGAEVTGIDIAENLIERARHEARAASCRADFEVGNAEALPYADNSFDVTMSMFGVMFAYRPEQAAAEMLRVTRAGGFIAMANWTADGVIGKMLRAHVAVVPPPAGLPSPLAWGDEATVRARLGESVTSLTLTRRKIELRFPLAPAEVTELFAACYGPTVMTLGATDRDGARKLRDSLTLLFDEHNIASSGGTVIAGEYLDVRAVVK